jgi:hypothetical protein
MNKFDFDLVYTQANLCWDRTFAKIFFENSMVSIVNNAALPIETNL